MTTEPLSQQQESIGQELKDLHSSTKYDAWTTIVAFGLATLWATHSFVAGGMVAFGVCTFLAFLEGIALKITACIVHDLPLKRE